MSFLERFNKEFYPLLNGTPSEKKKATYPNIFQRAEPFRLIFSLLEEKKQDQYHIVETGTTRKIGNWNDGQSSYLFQEFIKVNNGTLRSVDINEVNCEVARSILDPKYCSVTCCDSVKYLLSIDPSTVDLFFLDSYDVSWSDCSPSAEHHLKEFKAIESKLKLGSIIAIDDNTVLNGTRTGKGRDIFEYLKSKNIVPIYDKYMIIYLWR